MRPLLILLLLSINHHITPHQVRTNVVEFFMARDLLISLIQPIRLRTLLFPRFAQVINCE
jgi:hypothetical protein